MNFCLHFSPFKVPRALSVLIAIVLMAFFSKETLALVTQNPEPTGKFEWGAGLLSIKGAHYRGSDQSKDWFIPTPYFSYNSENIEVETSFARGTLYKNSWMAFKLSVLVGLNVESEDNRARAGMESLDYTFELGPMVIFDLWENPAKGYSLTFEAPFRMVNSTDLSNVHNRGFFSVPYLSWKASPHPRRWGVGYELSVAAMWGSRKYHEYFYGVAPWYVTAGRAYYQAKAGYSGTQFTIILNKRWQDVVILPFIRYDILDGAVFEESPLVKKKSYFVGGLGIFWLFGNKL